MCDVSYRLINIMVKLFMASLSNASNQTSLESHDSKGDIVCLWVSAK
jgi:hypothetical protein